LERGRPERIRAGSGAATDRRQTQRYDLDFVADRDLLASES
jgi:hypothetical protein